mmetsp:Transcript_36197/g.84880  ORF Transcript_36197/g.84880 Transcript_36197/m.84880 type:complete len:293 (-) Transcript_36197:178-1056(-)
MQVMYQQTTRPASVFQDVNIRCRQLGVLPADAVQPVCAPPGLDDPVFHDEAPFFGVSAWAQYTRSKSASLEANCSPVFHDEEPQPYDFEYPKALDTLPPLCLSTNPILSLPDKEAHAKLKEFPWLANLRVFLDTDKTTVMFRNLPSRMSRDVFLKVLDREGFECMYDFVYLPRDFGGGKGLGYAFVNFVTPLVACRSFISFFDFDEWPRDTIEGNEDVACRPIWSDPLQGLDDHIDRYRSSPVMHEDVPDEWKPIILKQGVRVPFPGATKEIKVPKAKKKIKRMERLQGTTQ